MQLSYRQNDRQQVSPLSSYHIWKNWKKDQIWYTSCVAWTWERSIPSSLSSVGQICKEKRTFFKVVYSKVYGSSLRVVMFCCGFVPMHFTHVASGYSTVTWAIIRWTHRGRDKMAANFQTTFSNAYLWIKIYEFRLILYWRLFLKLPARWALLLLWLPRQIIGKWYSYIKIDEYTCITAQV